MRGRAVLTAVAIACACAPAATATPPIKTSVTVTTPLMAIPDLTSRCGFTVLGASTVTFDVTRFVDHDGTVTRETTHGTIDGILVQASSGSTLRTKARWTETRDFGDGTISFSGLRFSVQEPGQPPVAVAVGQLVAGAGGVGEPDRATPRFSFPLGGDEICSAF
jgi:hypothetical protein